MKPVGDTDFFYRKDIQGDRVLRLNQIPLFINQDLIEKCEDTSILLEFFRSRKNLVLCLYIRFCLRQNGTTMSMKRDERYIGN